MNKKGKNLSILVVCGSANGEEEVSRVTANKVLGALYERGYSSANIYNINDPNNSSKIAMQQNQIIQKPDNNGTLLQPITTKMDLDIIRYLNKEKLAVVFNATHGSFGEDGKFQQLLDFLQIKYTHSGPLASMIGMDKYRFYELLSPHGINFPEYELFRIIKSSSDLFRIRLEFFLKKFNKVVVKPNNGGSSVGLMVVDNNNIEQVINYYYSDTNPFYELIICQYIDGVEVSCGVLCDKILDCVEIVPNCGIYNYEAKYISSDKNQYLIPPKHITTEQQKIIKDTSRKLHSTIGCKTISRSDFIVCKKTAKVYTLEINTQPGMTPASLIPKMAKYTLGMSYEELIETILLDAVK